MWSKLKKYFKSREKITHYSKLEDNDINILKFFYKKKETIEQIAYLMDLSRVRVKYEINKIKKQEEEEKIKKNKQMKIKEKEKKIIIGIIGAMDVEIENFKKIFKDIKIEKYLNFEFYKTTFNNNEIIFTCSEIGKVFSTITTTILIEKYKSEIILFSGVAGSLNNKLKIGDILIANNLVQHDVDISIFGYKKGYIPNTTIFEKNSPFIKQNKKLINIINEIKKDISFDFNITEGIIATGDQFVSSNNKKNEIKKEYNADAIEMEGASVAIVSKLYKVPSLIIRSISDNADDNATQSFDDFVKIAASNSSSLIMEVLKKINNDI